MSKLAIPFTSTSAKHLTNYNYDPGRVDPDSRPIVVFSALSPPTRHHRNPRSLSSKPTLTRLHFPIRQPLKTPPHHHPNHPSQPPKWSPPTPPLTITLKSHTTTLYLLLPASTPLTTLTTTLFETLTTSSPHLPLTPPTSVSSLKLGLPKDTIPVTFQPLDESSLRGKPTLTSLGIKDGTILAFEVVNHDYEGEWDGDFTVVWASDEEDQSQSQSQG
ncbi:hypothetical protein TWF106_009762 [Orbilia oligospora]|uniref:Uncharacterized protein n=1 Tax=Orbilia oligospora TaxID=2813651 RepID=A0A6G1MP13_ORBOL|nr:hypothetical protein TWF106_009762 [Orbilia oligospora]KAF3215367.1 hypothetical protein TWF191_009345 [Orbilia oligospora]KAF3265657.1 hypothetical protein TWF192_000302 [Orbilia oligospora]